MMTSRARYAGTTGPTTPVSSARGSRSGSPARSCTTCARHVRGNASPTYGRASKSRRTRARCRSGAVTEARSSGAAARVAGDPGQRPLYRIAEDCTHSARSSGRSAARAAALTATTSARTVRAAPADFEASRDSTPGQPSTNRLRALSPTSKGTLPLSSMRSGPPDAPQSSPNTSLVPCGSETPRPAPPTTHSPSKNPLSARARTTGRSPGRLADQPAVVRSLCELFTAHPPVSAAAAACHDVPRSTTPLASG